MLCAARLIISIFNVDLWLQGHSGYLKIALSFNSKVKVLIWIFIVIYKL